MKNFKKIMLLCFLFSSIFSIPTFAQDDLKKEINRIKKDNSYIYAEVTAPTEEEAKEYASALLNNEIQTWAQSQTNLKDNLKYLVTNIKAHTEEISLPRGNMTRCFLYVKKSDISGGDGMELLTNNVKKDEEPAQVSETAPSAGIIIPETIKELIVLKEYYDFVNKIQELKNENKINHYGRYASLSNPDVYYLAIYDHEGRVLTILSPGPSRVNLNSGNPDDVVNYSGCGAIGFTLP